MKACIRNDLDMDWMNYELLSHASVSLCCEEDQGKRNINLVCYKQPLNFFMQSKCAINLCVW